jgi:hypothetical protein
MNFKIIIVLVLITIAIIVVNVDFGVNVNTNPQNTSNKKDINIIQPLQLEKQNEDVSQHNGKISSLVTFDNPQVTMQKRPQGSESRFTKEGQAYTTLGELMMKNKKKVDTTSYSIELLKQIKQAKYNLKIAKEMAYLSKDLFVETGEGNKIDEKVYQKIKDLRDDLIVELKNQSAN